MDNSSAFERQFNHLAASIETGASSVERQIHGASIDSRLMVAVQDELCAEIEQAFPFGGELRGVYNQRHDDARARVLEVALHLQHEYGLDEKSILKAVELARLDIQNNKIIFD